MSPTATAREDDAISVLCQRGDRSFYIRQAKLATIRFLKAKRPKSTRPLRSKLWPQRYGPTFGEALEDAVREVQRIAGLPVTGEITFSVDAELAAYWPRDSRGRRVLRATPAWKLIPGQVSPNFNVREFACHDGTGYIEGLMRERGLGRDQALDRAKSLASRLERVRTRRGGQQVRLTSVYRTTAYNARIGGASHSAHTYGYATDVPPAPGQTLSRHRDDMRIAFESGIGFYPRANFVHGDFDPKLGRREWTG